MRRIKKIILLLTVFMTLAFMGVFDARADIPTVKATGILTSIEEDGSVIIDNKGYKIDPSATILNRKGKTIVLRSLSLPAKVRFEYRQAKNGFIIVLIQQVKQVKQDKQFKSNDRRQ